MKDIVDVLEEMSALLRTNSNVAYMKGKDREADQLFSQSSILRASVTQILENRFRIDERWNELEKWKNKKT